MKDHAHAETLIPPIDGKIQGFWDPIPVSPDTVETTTDFAGDDEEVNYPADAFGASLSGNFSFNLARPRFTLGFKVCAVTSRLSVFLLRFLPDSYRFKVRDRPVCARLRLSLVSLDDRNRIIAELRSSDDHDDSATIVIVSFVVWPPAAFIPRLVSLRRSLRGKISVRLQGEIGLKDEIFHAGHFRELSG
ncbi:hypothetical protein F2Q69_00007714 [Brassica cretica]|uniref:Uncharacterized protein n=1 Tax=Brassica cretica TaxID=69181 RepID=A0A8S9P806_BRACR|nr:hypothetical protein F2Q69_00007714 [Brassica cretica]